VGVHQHEVVGLTQHGLDRLRTVSDEVRVIADTLEMRAHHDLVHMRILGDEDA